MTAFFQAELGPHAAPVNLNGIDWGSGLLVRSTNWLGDAIMALPGTYRLKDALPDGVKVALVCPDNLAALWRAVTWIDDVIELPGSRVTGPERIAIRQRGFGAAVILPNSVGSAYDIWRCRVPVRIGRAGKGRGPLLTHSLPPYSRVAGRDIYHQARYYLEFAACLGSPAWDCDCPPLKVGVSPERQRELRVPGDQAILVMAPGAAYGPAKQWPADRFRTVAKWWVDNVGPVISMGTTSDAKVAGATVDGVPHATSLAGKTSLDDLLYVLSRARCVLTNDSGTMHLAAALRRDGIAVFGSTDPIATGPIGGRWLICRREVSCSPCLKRRCPLSEGAYECLNRVREDDVIAGLKQLLAE